MRIPRAFSGAAIAATCVVSAIVTPGVESVAGAAALPLYRSASESYYRLDVPNGTMTVRVDVKFQALDPKKELQSVVLWAMPRAQNILVKQDDAALTTKSLPQSDVKGLPTAVTATLAKPVKNLATTELTLTYDVPAQSSELVKTEPGVIESLFVSQGSGSFVYVDVPKTGDNYFEPGCLRATTQPGDVSAAGFDRWICGEATIIAVFTDHKSLQEKCARADDSCRQRYEASPFAAFAQSITDPAKQGKLVEDVQLARGPVKLSFLYFRKDEAWATRQFNIAKAALPKLEALFGFNYPRDTVQLRESRFLANIGALGVAFTDEGDMLISSVELPGISTEEVTVHELAHQWAGLNLETAWLWEGLAEYGMRSLAPSLGIKLYDRKWESYKYKDLLGNWHNGSTIGNPDYWYGKAGSFWFAYQAAIGGQENMTRVLSLIDDDPKLLPVNGRWFMDRGEEVSGVSLEQLFLDWVWTPETAKPLLVERQTARELVKGIFARALNYGFDGVPSDIKANLDIWEFRQVASQVARANEVLDAYAAVVAAENAAGLKNSPAFGLAWRTRSVSESATFIHDMRNTIGAIVSSTAQLASDPPDSFPHKKLAEAREKYEAGDIAGAKLLAAGSVTTSFNQQASERMLQQARERQSTFSASFWGKIGLFLQDPEGELASAEKAYLEGDFAKAFTRSRSALGAWDNADATGQKRLSALAGLMSGLTVLVWWLMRKLDLGGQRLTATEPAGVRAGHSLATSEPKSSWREWENKPKPKP